MFCVRQSSVRDCHFTCVCLLLLLLLNCRNVRRFPPPSRSTNCVTLVPKPGRKEGHAVRELSLLRGIAVLTSGDRRWLPEAVLLERLCDRCDRRLATVLQGRGGVAAVREGAEESAPFARRPEPTASAMLGRSSKRGTRCQLLSIRRSHHHPPGGGGAASHPPKDVQYHRMAPQVKASQLVEDRAAFSFSPLSRLCLSSSFRLLFSRLVCPYPQVRRGRPDGAPPGGGGGSRAQSRGYPRPARGGM